MTVVNTNRQLVGFFIVLGLMAILVGLLIWPFWQLLALAAIFAVLFHPWYQKINLGIRNSNLAALTSVVIILLVAILPLWFIGQVLFNEIVDIYNRFRLGELVFNQSNLADYVPPQLQHWAQIFSNDINSIISKLTGGAFELVSRLVSNIATFFLSLFLLIFMTFFFLRDGQKIKQLIWDISPLSSVYDQALFAKVEQAVAGVVKGAFLVALIQGVVATVGFMIFGLPQPILWGAFTVIAAIVPQVGTSLSLVPAVIFLFLTGHSGAAVGLAVWGALAVGLIDNILAPKLVGSKIQLHPLLVLLSVVGGIALFGFLGFLFGPIIMSVFVTLVDIYRTDLKQK